VRAFGGKQRKREKERSKKREKEAKSELTGHLSLDDLDLLPSSTPDLLLSLSLSRTHTPAPPPAPAGRTARALRHPT